MHQPKPQACLLLQQQLLPSLQQRASPLLARVPHLLLLGRMGTLTLQPRSLHSSSIRDKRRMATQQATHRTLQVVQAWDHPVKAQQSLC